MTEGGEPAARLLERSRELGAIDALIDRTASGRGGLLALEGPAGIGKTALLRAAAALASARGLAVLAAAGSELERGFAFGVARRLFEGTLARAEGDRRAALLDGAARLAAPALGLDAVTAQGASEDARYGAVHGLYWLTANIAADRTLLVVVDDLQWADAPSQRYLAYLARRLEGAPIGVLVGLRPALPGEDREVVAAILGASPPLRPEPLSEEAVAAVAAGVLGAVAGPELARACHRATGGNALLVHEVLAELGARGAGPGSAAGVAAFGAERLGDLVRRRIGALPEAAGALAAAIAVLGDGCSPLTAGVLAGLDDEEVADAAAALAAADILADGLPLAFRHPVVAAAVAEATPALRRAAAHRRAARRVADAGAPAPAVASHLRRAAPAGDGWAVDALRASAREALAQGASREAAADLARALAEPPPSALRGAVLRELGRAEAAAGLPEGPDHLRAARDLEGDPVERARIGLELADGLYERMRAAEAAEVARTALAGLAGADRELELTLEVLVAQCVRMDMRVGGDEPARLRERAAGLAGDTPAERAAIASASLMGEAGSAAEHAATAEALERLLERGPLPASADTAITSSLIRASRLDMASALIESKLADARSGGLAHRYALMAGMRGWLALERGALADAEADLAAAIELADELSLRTAPYAGMLAQALAEQGRTGEADAVMEDHGIAGDLPEHQVVNPLLYARARARLAEGREDAALEDAREVGRRYEAWAIRRAVPAWRSLAAEVLARRGARDEARALAYEELGLAERWGTPLAMGLAWRGVGLATGEVTALETAAEQLARSPNRLEWARALVDLGAALRRGGRRADARGPLSEGMDVAHACGAAPLAERARQELRAAGARPRRLAVTGAQALTASERRVAGMAAGGLTNRAIAEALFVTSATVETHLRHAYRKLGIASREELPAALASGEGDEKIRVPG